MSKCQLFNNKLNFLGFIISEQGLEPDEAKVKAIVQMQPPTDLKDLRSFLGLCGFYHNLLQGVRN